PSAFYLLRSETRGVVHPCPTRRSSDLANGQEVFLKRDGTITNDWEPHEQQPIGNTEPWAQGTFGLNARYKQFTLYTTFLFEWGRSEEHTSELQSRENLVCRLLLEKKKY